jgi:hypothetical protein
MSTQLPNSGGQSSDSLTESQLVEQLLGAQQPQETEIESEEVEAEEEPEITEEEIPEVEEEEAEEETTEEDEITKLLLTDPDRLRDIARQAGVKSLSRFAELTAKNKALEAQLQAKQVETKPLPEALPDNPFRGLDAQQVEAKRKDLGKVAKTVEALLDEHEDYGPNDVITHDGHEFTKKQLKAISRSITTQLSEYIPDQLAEIQRLAQREQSKAQFDAAILEQIPAFSDENSEVVALHKSIMANPHTLAIGEKVPELSAQLSFIMAHAANSILLSQGKTSTTATAPGIKARPKVAASPVGAVATSARVEPNAKAKEREDKFLKSGRADDMVAMFVAKSR